MLKAAHTCTFAWCVIMAHALVCMQELMTKKLVQKLRPSREERDKRIDELKAKIDQLREPLNAITAEINERKKYKSGNRVRDSVRDNWG
jgi:phage shock protein A